MKRIRSALVATLFVAEAIAACQPAPGGDESQAAPSQAAESNAAESNAAPAAPSETSGGYPNY